MARINTNQTKVQSVLKYNALGVPVADLYVDVAEGLSMVNRKLFSQQYCYNVKSIRSTFSPSPTYDQIRVVVTTAGDTWSVHNAWTKAQALHSEMQQLVLDDNPSIEGKWNEFKVYLDQLHSSGTQLKPAGALGFGIIGGEWNHSTFVMPQHDVDAATGLPLAALEVTSHILGDDTATGRGLIKAYAESRATVQPNAPAVPATFEDSFYNLLTDSGSQEPELAAVIIDENDQPPYDQNDYPGGDTNAIGGFNQATYKMNINSPNLYIPSFTAQCGLVHITVTATLAGDPAPVPPFRFLLDVERGAYKGLDAIPMGQ